MEPNANQTTDIYHWVAWAHARRRQLALWTGAAAAVGLGIWLYVWNDAQHATKASEALSELRPVQSAAGAPREPVAAAAYLRVANQYPGTTAGGRAQLLAAGASFAAGNFKEAQGQFEKFMLDYPDSPWLSQAQLGEAASLEAQGNSADAIIHYRQFVDRHPQDPALPQAKSALARLYLDQNKPDQALKLYQELARERNNDSWTMEANVQAEELLAMHPELRPKPVVAPPVVPPSTPSLSLTGAPPVKLSPPPAAAKPDAAKSAVLNTTNNKP